MFGIGGEVAVEVVEARLPEVAAILDPAGGGTEAARVEAAVADAAAFLAGDEAGTFKDVEMLLDGSEGHVEGLGKRAHIVLTCGKALDDGAPGGVGESVECGV